MFGQDMFLNDSQSMISNPNTNEIHQRSPPSQYQSIINTSHIQMTPTIQNFSGVTTIYPADSFDKGKPIPIPFEIILQLCQETTPFIVFKNYHTSDIFIIKFAIL